MKSISTVLKRVREADHSAAAAAVAIGVELLGKARVVRQVEGPECGAA